MTRDYLKKCFGARKEMLIIERQIQACNEETHNLQRLIERRNRITAELDTVEEYIDSLDSSLLRQIVTLHYVEGMSLKETASFVGYSESSVKRIIRGLFPASE